MNFRHPLLSYRSALFLVAVALCAAAPVRADFLYDFTASAFHVEFTEPAILTSITTVSSFILDTSTGSAVTSVQLDPLASDTCNGGGITVSGACVEVNFSSGSFFLFFSFPTFTTVGSFTNPAGATITISQIASTPEPSSLLLLVTIVGGLAFATRKRSRGRWSLC